MFSFIHNFSTQKTTQMTLLRQMGYNKEQAIDKSSSVDFQKITVSKRTHDVRFCLYHILEKGKSRPRERRLVGGY